DENDINDLASLEVYDPKTDTWENKAPLPQGLRGLTTAVLDNQLYVMGGESGDGFNPVLHDNVLVYNPETDLWQELNSKLPQPISVATAQTVNGVIYLIGGHTYGQDLNTVYYWPEKPLVSILPEPVILVPGIMGSFLNLNQWQIDPIFHTYDNLMEALIAAGYKENSLNEAEPTLFTFPYDWRQDNNLTANLLKQKIQQVKTLTGRDKVDIIAHSMGGLVARSYIQGSDYQNDIDQVIFLGTPHQGSLESYLKYEGGNGFFTTGEKLAKYLFQTEAATQGYFDLTDYIRVQVPTVEQMLPVFNYLKDKQPDNIWQLRAYPLNYPQNNYLENLNSPANIDLLKQRAKITNIIGDLGLNSTLNYLKVIADPDLKDNKWQSGYPENLDKNLDSLEMGNGDSTVPLKSAGGLIGVETIETANSDHTNLPTVMQKEIIKTLTGKEPADYFNNKLTSFIKKWLFFRVYSPVDFAVIAPDGSKIGKDFLNNTEINQIPDAFYSGFSGSAEFVLIPNPLDGPYKVEVQGVDNGGEYTLANSIIDGNIEISKEYSGAIAPAQQRDFTINYAASSENPLSDLEPMDTVPPVVVINKPVENDKYLHSDSLIIDYTATDDFSGLATTTITIDNQTVATTTIYLFDYSLGMHNLTITAIDKAGNQAQQQINFEVIANIDSTISDIEKIYELGWLKDQVYHKLLKDAFKLLKTEAKYLNQEQELTEKLIKKTGADSKLTDKQKQKLIEQYTKKLAELKQNRAKAINKNLDLIIKLLNKAKDKNQINQQGYDIILSDVNYLKENL
ncbi:MAG: alpha/beta hydrolase, partial [Parcubacteria group bacterium]|nr:alpha/beta hydrolase [Parcubacteria group bacterium]